MGRYSLGAAALAALGVATASPAAEPTPDELQAQIQALQAKVAQLEQAQTQAVSKADVDATVASVLKDAEKRSQLLQLEGFTAGYSNGKFILRSGDGNYLLHPYFQFQFRNTTTWREDAKGDGDDDIQNGFEIRRMKFGFDGNVFTPDLTYQFQWAVDRKSGSTNLEDAWLRYKFADDWAVRAGQLKDPLAHESILSSKRLLAAERSLLNDTFSPGDNYTQGITLIFGDKGPLHIEGGFTDGKNTPNQNYQDFPNGNTFDWGAAARAEWKLFGDWKAYDDYTSMGNKDSLMVLGAGADYSEAGSTDVFTHTLDAQFETSGGLALYGAYYGQSTKNSPAGVNPPATTPPTAAPTENDLYDWGFMVQGSYLMGKFEPFARYDFIKFDSAGLPGGSETDISEITAGVNYYIQGHNAKITVDVGWLPNGAPKNDDGAGILANDEEEFYLRGQFQLLL